MWWNSKTQTVRKFKNSNGDETQKLKLWWNSKKQIVTQLKNSNCDKNLKYKVWQNSKIQIKTKLKLWRKKLKMSQNSNFDKTKDLKLNTKTQKIKLWCNSKTQTVWKLKFDETEIVMKFEKSNYDENQKLKCWQNLKYDKS